jgi:large subunit ribosomal protein L25
MEIIKLTANRRTDSGKGPSNRLRRAGQIPAIAYGKDHAAVSVSIAPKGLLGVLGSDHGQNSVVELDIDGKEKLTVMVRAYAYHPITCELTHADFLTVKLDQPVDVEVPFHLTGKSKGVILGGVLQQVYRKIPVRCLPDQIPAHLDIDVTELDINDSYKASELKLPPGVKVRIPEDQTVVVCAAPEKAGAEEAAASAAGAAAASAAGAVASGAPSAAAGDKAAPAAAAGDKAAAAAKPAAKPAKK